ncbi:MAG: Hpt domain-containing protein [Caldilineaceae bacterium]
MGSSILDTDRVSSLLELDTPNAEDSFFADLVAEFSTEADQLIRSLKRALLQQDNVACAASSHSLKGASLNLGAIALVEVCEAIEGLARQNHLSQVSSRLAELDLLYQSTIQALETLKPQAV